MLRRSQRLRPVNRALGRPWCVRCTSPQFFTLSLSWDLSTSLICQRGHILVLAVSMKSISYTSSQWGKITSGIGGMLQAVAAIGGHIYSAKKGAMICLWFSVRSAVWLILNVALDAFLQVTTCTVGRFGLEPCPQVALKIEGRLIGGWHPSLCWKVQCLPEMELTGIVICSE